MRRLASLLAGAVLVSACGAGATTGGPAAIEPVVIQPQAIADPVAPAPGVPVKIELPSLAVTDDVIPVALDPIGEMELPPVTSTGWYRLAPKPGDVGRAVLASHVDYDGVKGAFNQLDKLRVGDAVVVTDTAGAVRTFRVYDVRTGLRKDQYQQITVPIVFGATPQRELALVTCGGTLVGRSYDSNTVARARLA